MSWVRYNQERKFLAYKTFNSPNILAQYENRTIEPKQIISTKNTTNNIDIYNTRLVNSKTIPSNVNKHIKYDDTSAINIEYYKSSLDRIEKFNNSNKNSIITFIIPSINRKTLIDTIYSLQNQYINSWKAIIIFDNCYPDINIINILENDDRFLYISIKKTGFAENSAGNVRNIGMTLVNTEWIGFVDDDDYLTKDYVLLLYKEINTYNSDVIIFRMNDPKLGIVPNKKSHLIDNPIYEGNIGISFCYKKELFNQNIFFEPSCSEDYFLINKISQLNKKILISKYITYYVRHYKDNIDINIEPVIINNTG